MLGQSSHGQTRQPLLSLDFGDRDLTDAFVDVRDGNHSSISGFGHPRGSTPISILSSRRSTPSTALSMETSESRRALPNMSALLDFLDNDNSNPFPPRPSSSRKQKASESYRDSCSPRSIATTTHHANSATPRPAASDFDVTSNLNYNFINTFNNTHRFQTVLPTSSTPFTRNHDDSVPEEISEISSPLSKIKRHVLPPALKSNVPSPHFSEQISNHQMSPSFDAPVGHLPGRSILPLETPARVTSKGRSAADRLAAAVMEGAPESHWTFRAEYNSTLNQAGIRRSKVVEELLQPLQPSISCAARYSNHIPDVSRSANDDDLPKSLVDETRRSSHVPHPPIIPSGSTRQSRLTKSAGYSPSPNLVRPIPQRPSTLPPVVCSQEPNIANPSTSNEQDEFCDARVKQLLSLIQSDRLEKARLVSSLTEARAEVASLRDEVRLLRMGVQKLGEGRSYQSADAILEPHRSPKMTLVGDARKDGEDPRPQPSSSRCQRESLEVWLSENTLAPTTNIGKSKSIDTCPEQPEHLPSSRSNHSNEINRSSRNKRPVLPGESTSSQKNRLDKLGNQSEDLIEKFTTARKSTESSIMNDLTKQFLGDLALGLSFTRHVDQLLMNPISSQASSEEQQSKFRPDSEIFTPVNLDRLVCRLKVWKQIVLFYSNPSNKSKPPPAFNTHFANPPTTRNQ